MTLFAAKSAMESRSTFAKKFSSVCAKSLKRILSPRCESLLREKRFGMFFRSPNPKPIGRIRWLGQNYQHQRYHQRYHSRTPSILYPAQQNFRRQRENSPNPGVIRQSWLTQGLRERDSRKLRMIRISHLANQTFQQKDNIPNSQKIWIEFSSVRTPLWGVRDRRGTPF